MPYGKNDRIVPPEENQPSIKSTKVMPDPLLAGLSSYGSGLTLGGFKPLVGLMEAMATHPLQSLGYVGRYYTGQAKQLPPDVYNVYQGTVGKIGEAQEAAPVSSIAGEAASYLTPGGGVKALYKVGEKAASKVLSKVPAKVAKYVAPSIKTAAGLTAAETGKSTVEAISGEKKFSDIPQTAKQAAVSGAIGGPVGSVISKALTPLSGVLAKYAGKPLEVIREYIKNPTKLKAAFNSEKDIAIDLVEKLKTAASPEHPDYKAARKILDELDVTYPFKPKVPLQKTVDQIDEIVTSKQGRFIPKEEEAVINKLKDLKERIGSEITAITPKTASGIPSSIKATIKSPAQYSFKDAEKMKQTLQKIAEGKYGKEASGIPDEYSTAIKNIARTLRESIEESAEMAGKPEYAAHMAKYASAVKSVEEVKKLLGKNFSERVIRAEKVVKGLHKPQSKALDKIEEFDRQFGTNYAEQAKTAMLSRLMGEGGTPGWFPESRTGYGVPSLLLGASSFGAGQLTNDPELRTTLRALGGLLAAGSSPKVATKLIQLSDMSGKAIPYITPATTVTLEELIKRSK